MNAQECKYSKVADDAAPGDLGMLEIEEQSEMEAGCSQIVEALSEVFVGQRIHTLQFNKQALVDHQVGYVFADGVSLIADLVEDLGPGRYPAERQFFDER